MSSQDDKDNELQRREQELQARERAIRLRELEAEINQPLLYQTQKSQKLETSAKQRYGKLIKVGQFFALVIAVVVAIRIATALAFVIMVGAVAWVAYKIFFQSDRAKR